MVPEHLQSIDTASAGDQSQRDFAKQASQESCCGVTEAREADANRASSEGGIELHPWTGLGLAGRLQGYLASVVSAGLTRNDHPSRRRPPCHRVAPASFGC